MDIKLESELKQGMKMEQRNEIEEINSILSKQLIYIYCIAHPEA
jgi:hypothetical protein